MRLRSMEEEENFVPFSRGLRTGPEDSKDGK
jgi:hypothetical protein